MKNKIMLGVILILIFIVSIGIGIYIGKIRKVQEFEMDYTSQVLGKKVTDECTQEAKDLLEANAGEEKVSPNAIIIEKTSYNKCGHTIKRYVKVDESLVNLSKEGIKKLYLNWNLDGFSSEEIVFSRKVEGICDEHFVLREEDEHIVIYKIDELNNEKIYERTGILTKYLPETDKLNIKNGIYVNGKEALNCLIEDYE